MTDDSANPRPTPGWLIDEVAAYSEDGFFGAYVLRAA